MGRPADYQWQPLGVDSDPVPGDPERITQEAHHLASVANQIIDQVAALRKIASAGEEVGKHADVIRSSATDLADQLDKVVGRYQKVSSALNGWIPDLEEAQALSIQALNQAEVPHQQITSLQSQSYALPSGNLTPQEQQQMQAHTTALRRAQDELDAAKALLNRATTLRDNSASRHAGLINSACDDGMKDSWWDHFKDWVDQYAWLIKDICTVLEVIATILAIVALFIPGLNIVAALLWIGFALTAAALLGRIMLAATGNGSWFDVAMDAFALLTFGVGKAASGALKAVAEGGEGLGKGLVQGERALMLAKSEQFLSKAADLFDDQALCKIAVKQLQNIEKLAPEVGELQGKLPLLARMALKLGGTSEDVGNLSKIFSLAQRFGSNPAVAANLASGKLFTAVLGVNAFTSFSAGVGVPALGGLELDGPNGKLISIPAVPIQSLNHLYAKIEDGTTMDGGFSTAQVDDALAALGSVTIPPLAPVFSLTAGAL